MWKYKANWNEGVKTNEREKNRKMWLNSLRLHVKKNKQKESWLNSLTTQGNNGNKLDKNERENCDWIHWDCM